MQVQTGSAVGGGDGRKCLIEVYIVVELQPSAGPQLRTKKWGGQSEVPPPLAKIYEACCIYCTNY